MALYNSTKEGLDHYQYSSPLIESLLTNSILTTKYVLERENYFPTFCRPEKQEMSINSDEIFEKLFQSSKIQVGPIVDTCK